MGRNKKHSFTLLELMICLSLISLVGTLVAIKGMDLVAHHRFTSSLQEVLFDLQRHQILAMTEGRDVLCKIAKNPEGAYFASFTFDGKDAPYSSHLLKEISQIRFQGKIISEFESILYSTGRINSLGVLSFEAKKHNEDPLWIDFSYPICLQKGPIPASKLVLLPPYPDKSI